MDNEPLISSLVDPPPPRSYDKGGGFVKSPLENLKGQILQVFLLTVELCYLIHESYVRIARWWLYINK